MQNTLLAYEPFFLQIFTSIMLLFVTSNTSFLSEICCLFNFEKRRKTKSVPLCRVQDELSVPTHLCKWSRNPEMNKNEALYTEKDYGGT